MNDLVTTTMNVENNPGTVDDDSSRSIARMSIADRPLLHGSLGSMCSVGEPEKKGGGITAGIFGVGALLVAVFGFWVPLVQGEPALLVGVGTGVVLMVAIALWARHEEEGELVFRVQLRADPIPAPHPSRVPPLVSLYSRGVVIGDDGRVQPHAQLPAKVNLRRRRLDLDGLKTQLLEEGLNLATATAPSAVVEEAEYRYTHRFGREVDVGALAAIADLLRDPAGLARCGIRKDRPYTNERHVVRLCPIDDAVPGREQEWRGAVPPSRFGHPLDDVAPGARCGSATELLDHHWLTGVLNDPSARFRDPDGTLYLATGRPLLPDETGCSGPTDGSASPP